jgi:hypothetical protein
LQESACAFLLPLIVNRLSFGMSGCLVHCYLCFFFFCRYSALHTKPPPFIPPHSVSPLCLLSPQRNSCVFFCCFFLSYSLLACFFPPLVLLFFFRYKGPFTPSLRYHSCFGVFFFRMQKNPHFSRAPFVSSFLTFLWSVCFILYALDRYVARKGISVERNNFIVFLKS